MYAPVPRGPHNDSPQSEGLILLTEQRGSVFADLVDAKGKYRKLLVTDFLDRVPAVPIRTREDYESVRLDLEAAIAEEEVAAATAQSQQDLF